MPFSLRGEMTTMLSKITVLPLVVPVLLVTLGTSAPASPTAWPRCQAPTYPGLGTRQKLGVHICGPSRVVRGKNYSYTVVLANFIPVRYRKITLSVIHHDPITRSSIPYRRVYNYVYGEKAAVWTLRNFKARPHTFRVSFMLPFKQHDDKKGSNLIVDARGYGPSAVVGGLTHDVFFIK